MQLNLEDLIFIQQYRAFKNKNKKKFIQHTNNPLLITRFRRFIVRHKSDDGSNIATPKCF